MSRPLAFLSVCSGIEAASVAWEPLGWRAHAFAEIEAFPSAVLAARYPGVPNWGDMTRFRDWPDATVDLLVGGTPCQSFSVAGLRRGMADPRGNLALTYLAIADRYRPEWLVWENVPGVLSSSGGRDFGAFLGGLGELGYGFAYRVLDAQYVRVDGFARAVPQRRRRVFVVGHSGDWRRAAAVLFEPESLSGNPPPRREAGQGIAPTIAARTQGGGGLGADLDCDGGLFARCDTAGEGTRQDFETTTLIAHALRADGFDASEDGTGRGTPLVPVVAKTITRGAESAGKGGYAGRRQEDDDNLVATPYTLAIGGRGDTHQLEYRQDGTANAVLTPNGGRAGIGVGAVAIQDVRDRDKAQNGIGVNDDGVAYTVDAAATQGVAQGWAVRRLTPIECERLQGFPDNYTLIPYRGKPAADGPRYKALGNSMAVNVMRWIGRRIDFINSIADGLSEAA
jgi:DNA (cytosine-5)-methyltransferase 1